MPKKHSVHLYLEEEVYNYLVAKLEGTQSLSSYFLQKSGIMPEFRNQNKQTPVTPQLVEAQLSCATCTLVQCDPSCALLDKSNY